MVQMQYKDSILRAICSGLERQEEWGRQTRAHLLQGLGGSLCSRLTEQKTRWDQPRSSPDCTLALISRAVSRSGCSAVRLCSQHHAELLQPCLEINKFCLDTTEVWLWTVIDPISNSTYLDS